MSVRVTIYWDRQDPQNEGWAYRITRGDREDSGALDITGEDVGKREAYDALALEIPEEDLPAYEDFRPLEHDGPGWEARGAA